MLFWSHPATREESEPTVRALSSPNIWLDAGKCGCMRVEESDCEAQLALVPASSEFIENVK